ncbi:MAG: response regulator transcription factor [Verrucomicrobiales bacterium]|nr:response regulator transcription factor [Verrucomicrobiales bacterium]
MTPDLSSSSNLPAEGHCLRTTTVLVVDDIPNNLTLLLDALSGAGHRVLVAESGEGALLQLEHEIPDVVLLDYVLPGLTGLEVCRRLKAQPRLAEIPVIFLTAVTDVEEKVRVLEAGAVDYVTKPIQTAEVVARVATHLRIAQLKRALLDRNAALEAEIAMRIEAEEQLRSSLDRALLVTGPDGRIHFATKLAQTLLLRFFPGVGEGQLPPPLRGLNADALPPELEVRAFSRRDSSDFTVLELRAGSEAQPVLLMALGLTPREAEILFWISEGKTNPEIAVIVGSAVRTVEKHVERILGKLGVENRGAAARRALEVLQSDRRASG